MRSAPSVIGEMPYRMALAGGWIDQPFVSERDPSPPGSMVVVALEPDFRFMDGSGMATSTRKVASRLWGGGLPSGDPAALVRELYAEENRGRPAPSGSQDMIGLVYPGVNRLDFVRSVEGGVFPSHIEGTEDPAVAAWIEETIKVLPVAQRPPGYSPLGVKNLDPAWVRRLGASGTACYAALVARDLAALQASMEECMLSWEAILPGTLRHPRLQVDLVGLLDHYRREYGGAMYSGCGGGYLYVATDREVPGSFRVRVRLSKKEGSR